MIAWPLIFRLVPYIALVIGSLSVSYKLTADHFRSVIAEKELAYSKAIQAAEERVIAAQKVQQNISNKVSNDYEKKRDEIDRKYGSAFGDPSIGLRVSPSGSSEPGHLSAVPKSTGGLDAAAKCDGFSKELRKAAEKQSFQLIYLQDWIRKQQAAAQ